MYLPRSFFVVKDCYQINKQTDKKYITTKFLRSINLHYFLSCGVFRRTHSFDFLNLKRPPFSSKNPQKRAYANFKIIYGNVATVS